MRDTAVCGAVASQRSAAVCAEHQPQRVGRNGRLRFQRVPPRIRGRCGRSSADTAALLGLRPRRAVLQPCKIFARREDFSCHARPVPFPFLCPKFPCQTRLYPPEDRGALRQPDHPFPVAPAARKRFENSALLSRFPRCDRGPVALLRLRPCRSQRLRTCDNARNFQRAGYDAAAAAGTAALLRLQLRRPVFIVSR